MQVVPLANGHPPPVSPDLVFVVPVWPSMRSFKGRILWVTLRRAVPNVALPEASPPLASTALMLTVVVSVSLSGFRSSVLGPDFAQWSRKDRVLNLSGAGLKFFSDFGLLWSGRNCRDKKAQKRSRE